ncbi:MAG: hypothetical protein DCF19_08240 [Pseudanabaena frigida]|uniref:NACHT domain-containing protein n=1 Tax=Pseudanabaena frigida TaxID=945775 RepID=A0A2W4YGL5_9CYAN|nr:MAG: hypothetical protein DCF19_08240 [Pseudanabaena frigida]
MGVEICFDNYLRSVVSAYQQWWRLYTLTDATGRESQRVERDRISPAFFDFGLMVQTVEPPKAEQERELEQDREKKEKIERLPVLEGICKYAAEHVLLVGRPGSGKSTALARLLLQEAENALSIAGAKIPVLVELRYLPSEANESSVCDRILAFMHKHDPALDIDEAGIKQLLRQGRLLLLVDGVNELPSDRGRVMVNQFRELYQKTCPMIFTTRELSAGGDLGIAKRLEMQPLTEPQMQQFVMAYLPTQGERLLRQLSGRLREFGQTPLLLWMLCSLFQHPEFKGQIPPNLGMVFRAFTVGYGDRIKQDVTLSKDSRAWWGRLLQYLAFKMTCGESLTELQVAISRREAEQILVEFLRGKVEFADDCAVRWLEDLLKHHLIQISNDRIEFRHQLIQEYYAAEWLLGLLPSLSDARLQQGYLNYLKWTEPLALMLELVEGEEQAVRVVRLALEVDLRLGARLAGAVKYGLQEKTVGVLIWEIDERKIPKLYAIELLGETRSDRTVKHLILNLNDTNPHVRRNVAESLGKIIGDKAIEMLIHTLQDIDSEMRWYAAEALDRIRNEKAVDVLIISLSNIDSNLRINAAKSLGNIGSDKAIDALIIALNDIDPSVRWYAAEALGNIGSDKAIDALIIALNDIDPSVRWYAAEALGNIGSDKAIDALIIALNDIDPSVRWYAAEALGNIGSDKAIDALIIALNDIDPSVRWYAAEALGNIGSDKAIDALIIALNDIEPSVCRIAAEALSKIGGDKAIDFLVESLKDEQNSVSAGTAESLNNIGGDKAIDFLIGSLKDKRVSRHISVTEALSKISSEKVVKHLIHTLHDTDFGVRWYAADALAKIGTSKAIKLLIHTLNDINSDIRWYAVDALGKIGCKEAIHPLIYTLRDVDSFVRGLAAEALGKIDSKESVNALIYALRDPDSFVRRLSAEALGKINSKESINAFIYALRDPDSSVRRLAAEALGKIDSKESINPLIYALRDPDSSVRRLAAEALGKIDSKESINPLIYALRDPDSSVRRLAAEALGKIDSKESINPLIYALRDPDFLVRKVVSEALGKIGITQSTKTIAPLIYAFRDTEFDSDVCRIIATVLVNIANTAKNLPTLTKYLPYLLTLIPTEASQQALSVITAIQARCKYYNYDIAQTPLPPEDNPNPTTGNTYIFNDKVGQVVENLTVQRDNIATQNNQKTLPES